MSQKRTTFTANEFSSYWGLREQKLPRLQQSISRTHDAYLTALKSVTGTQSQDSASSRTTPTANAIPIASVTDTARRVLQHLVVVFLFRTELRHQLDLQRVLKFVDSGRRSIRNRVSEVFSGRNTSEQDQLKAEGVPIALHNRVKEITETWESLLTTSSASVHNYITSIVSSKAQAFDFTRTSLLKSKQGYNSSTSYLPVSLKSRENFLASSSRKLYEIDIWMENDGLPFGSVISEACFDPDDYEKKRLFRLLMLLLPSPNREILQGMLFAASQAWPAFNPSFGPSPLTHFTQDYPPITYNEISLLFCVPEEVETILLEPALMDYLSEEGLSTKQLLQRCNSYLDTKIPSTSRIFSSLHFAWSMFSSRASVLSNLGVDLREEDQDSGGGRVKSVTSSALYNYTPQTTREIL